MNTQYIRFVQKVSPEFHVRELSILYTQEIKLLFSSSYFHITFLCYERSRRESFRMLILFLKKRLAKQYIH